MEDTANGALGARPKPASTDPADDHGVPSDAARLRSPEQAERLVLDLIADHADSLLRMARRYSLCADDAQDAYQRGLEILMRHAHRLDADRAGGWLHTVVKHEAMAVNRSRRRIVGGEEIDLDNIEVRTAPSPEDRVLSFERVARSAEALQRLKPQEVRALWLKAMGNSYQEICDSTGWSYTKVNRCLAEGRKSFLARYAGIESGEECERWAPALSAMVDGEATADQLVELRPHLRNCGACQATVRELRGSSAPLVALFPVGGVVVGEAPGRLDTAGQFVARLWEMLSGSLHERAASTAYRAHSVVEAMTGGKLAATGLSVAAIAGGGIAVEDAVTSPSTAQRSELRATAPAPGVTPAVTAREPRALDAAPAVVAPAAAPTKSGRATERRSRPRRAQATIVAQVPTPATTAAATTAAPQPVARPQTTAGSPSTSAAPQAPAAPAGEFEVETP